MIDRFVKAWEENKPNIRKEFEKKHPGQYKDIVEIVLRGIGKCDEDGFPDADRIHEIDDGDYQGTLLYVIPERAYQPETYFCVKVSYGSCSGCDTLLAINDGDNGKPGKSQVDDYMKLALHIIQGMKEV